MYKLVGKASSGTFIGERRAAQDRYKRLARLFAEPMRSSDVIVDTERAERVHSIHFGSEGKSYNSFTFPSLAPLSELRNPRNLTSSLP